VRSPDISTSPDQEPATGTRSLAGRKRIQMLILLAALGSPACKEEAKEVPAPSPSASSSTAMPDVPYGEFEKEGYRGKFAADFAKELELRKGVEGFFLPGDYRWKMEEAMLKAGEESGDEGEVPCDEFWRTENAVLAVTLNRLFSQWSQMSLETRRHNVYRGPYVKEVYRHYFNLRFLEVLPDNPKKQHDDDYGKQAKEWGDLTRKAWGLTHESPFYGVPKGPKKAGPLDGPFKDTMLHLMEDMKKKMSYGKQKKNPMERGHENSLIASKVRTSVIDMYLPGMYLEAIRDRMERAEVEPEDIDFDEEEFERELKEAFSRRAEALMKSGKKFKGDAKVRHLFNMIGLKYKELSEMEHPLELYDHS